MCVYIYIGSEFQVDGAETENANILIAHNMFYSRIISVCSISSQCDTLLPCDIYITPVKYYTNINCFTSNLCFVLLTR